MGGGGGGGGAWARPPLFGDPGWHGSFGPPLLLNSVSAPGYTAKCPHAGEKLTLHYYYVLGAEMATIEMLFQLCRSGLRLYGASARPG